MSRSWKRTPWCGDSKGKSKKRCANQSVRAWLKQHPEELLNGSKYKNIYNRWDICDYGWIRTWKDYWNDCQRWHQEAVERGWGHYKDELNKEDEYRWWCKHYKNK